MTILLKCSCWVMLSADHMADAAISSRIIEFYGEVEFQQESTAMLRSA